MKFIETITLGVFVVNVIGILCVDIWLWTLSWCSGVGGLCGLCGFFVGYALSKDVVISKRDIWRNPKYDVFKVRLKYGNSIAGTVTVSVTVVMYLAKLTINF